MCRHPLTVQNYDVHIKICPMKMVKCKKCGVQGPYSYALDHGCVKDELIKYLLRENLEKTQKLESKKAN